MDILQILFILFIIELYNVETFLQEIKWQQINHQILKLLNFIKCVLVYLVCYIFKVKERGVETEGVLL